MIKFQVILFKFPLLLNPFVVLNHLVKIIKKKLRALKIIIKISVMKTLLFKFIKTLCFSLDTQYCVIRGDNSMGEYKTQV